VSYLNLDDKALNRCIQAWNKYFCNEAKVVMQGSPQTCLAAVWLQEWSGIKLPPLVKTGHFIGKKNQLHAHGGDGARGHGGLGAVPRESKTG
jgi:DMSO/TMAO reductase YedYZ molybdopterin-dependent catalytic subunit